MSLPRGDFGALNMGGWSGGGSIFAFLGDQALVNSADRSRWKTTAAARGWVSWMGRTRTIVVFFLFLVVYFRRKTFVFIISHRSTFLLLAAKKGSCFPLGPVEQPGREHRKRVRWCGVSSPAWACLSGVKVVADEKRGMQKMYGTQQGVCI